MNLKRIYYKFRYWNIISRVAKATDISQCESYRLIANYRKVFEHIYGRNFFKEVLLNYRIHYHDKKSKILNEYIKVIGYKEKLYKSDIVISLNLLNKYTLDPPTEKAVYGVFTRYFGDHAKLVLKSKAEQVLASGKQTRP
jgi:hypothetical protein